LNNYIITMSMIIRVFLKTLSRGNPYLVPSLLGWAAFSITKPEICKQISPELIVIILLVANQNVLMNIFNSKEFNVAYFSFYPVKERLVILSHNVTMLLYQGILTFCALSILVASGSQSLFIIKSANMYFVMTFIPIIILGNLTSGITFQMHSKNKWFIIGVIHTILIITASISAFFLTNMLRNDLVSSLFYVFLFVAYLVSVKKSAKYFIKNAACIMEGICLHYQ